MWTAWWRLAAPGPSASPGGLQITRNSHPLTVTAPPAPANPRAMETIMAQFEATAPGSGWPSSLEGGAVLPSCALTCPCSIELGYR